MEIPEKILMSVEKPARYIGGEVNAVEKRNAAIRFAFCFPDVYEVGMSHLGLQILYYFINQRADTYCERAFAPWRDMEGVMRRQGIPLFSLETKEPLCNFDFIGFTLQYELCYTNVLNMLDLSGIPIYSRARTNRHPIICAGGPCAYNPEPMADFVDFFFIGEGEAEQGLDAVFDRYAKGNRREFLEKIKDLPGIYVPSCHTGGTVKKVIVRDMDKAFTPDRQIVPVIEAVHDRAMLEVFRGCGRGCRFCQAGFVCRPARERSPDALRNQAETLIARTGYEEISLLSLSTGDYTGFQPLAQVLLDRFAGDNVNLSLPSTRVDAFTLRIMEKIQGARKSGLTFAPEAGTQRLRDVINKGITEEEILNGCGLAFEGGWSHVKLYFMIGLPTETDEDILGIADLAEKILGVYYKRGGKRQPNVSVSVSSFVPKPFTPFQWEAQNSCEEFSRKQQLLKRAIKNKRIKYTYHDSRMSVIEGALARGDRRAGQAVARVWELGARFDSWSEFFSYELWERAFTESGLAIEEYTGGRDISRPLPWAFISTGVSEEFLRSERRLAYEGAVTRNCGESCAGCGADAAFDAGGICRGV
ncbi:MAG: TIGR03960 family B12-binding radical SAM protein [Clostridiales bacterium]|nr:TIGR03960 family B12-binding radical SAM protein [Clostridiales bacterium]